jgi:hypothetical protein
MNETNNETNYETNLSYQDAVKLFEDSDFDAKDNNKTIGLLLYGMVREFNPATATILEDLTGLDLSTKDKLYDYLKKNIIFDDETIGKYALVLALSNVDAVGALKMIDEVMSGAMGQK